MNFSEAINNESKKTYTQNGAKARNTSSDALVDLFGSIGSLRTRKTEEITALIAEAYKEDALLATKTLFYARDVRGGLGERRVFQEGIKYLANYHSEALIPNLALIGEYGYYGDLYALIGTPVENQMWAVMKEQFEKDLQDMKAGKPVSLLAKWIKTADANSENTRKIGILTAKKLGYSVYDFKRLVRALRKHIDIVESHMSAKEYDKIDYSAVPSKAMLLYKDAFQRNDTERYSEFISAAVKGEKKINSSTLYPYELVKGMLNRYGHVQENPAIEAQWRQLPNYVDEDVSALVVSDLSASMTCNNMMPFASSIGLAIYFAEHNKGAYHNIFIPFSSDARIAKIKGDTLLQKITGVIEDGHGYCGSTNLEAAFKRVLDIAVKNNVPNDEMVKSLIVISDMEINQAVSDSNSWSFYEDMKAVYNDAGYDIPNVVFWNVNSMQNLFHADAHRKGVQLCSGQSASTFKTLIHSIGMTPYEMMLEVLNSERYAPITVETLNHSL